MSTIPRTDSLPVDRRRSSSSSLKPFGTVLTFLVDQLQFWIRLPLALFSPPRDQSSAVDKDKIKATVADVRHLINVALSAGVDQDLTAALNKLARNRTKIERAIVVWVDLIEVLVQYEEKRYGPRSGLGQIKEAELKRILQTLLRNQTFDLPNIPEAVQPLVIDYIIDWLVQAVVTACNSYGLWERVEPRTGFQFRVFLAQAKHWLGQLFSPLIGLVVNFVLWVKRSLMESVVLSPELQEAIEAVEKEGMIATSGDIIRQVIDIIVFVGEHAQQVKAGFELILTAVQEVETFSSLSGPEKKEYATDLIFSTLEELGFVEGDGLMGAIIETLISSGIEVAVHLFNKRSIFEN